MMQLLDTDGAWIAIGVSVLFIVVGVVMKRVFVNILKQSDAEAAANPTESRKND